MDFQKTWYKCHASFVLKHFPPLAIPKRWLCELLWWEWHQQHLMWGLGIVVTDLQKICTFIFM